MYSLFALAMWPIIWRIAKGSLVNKLVFILPVALLLSAFVPWLITPMFAHCEAVDLKQPAGLACVQERAEALLAKVRRKHKEYGIADKPFVIIKADDSSRELGFITLRDIKDIEALGRHAVARDLEPLDVLIQEGVPTYERVHDAVAEPVVYMIDRYVVGGFYRVHAERGVDESLNAPGSSFVPLAFAEPTQLPRPGVRPGASAPNRFYMYGVIARLAMVAASYELEATDPEAEALA